MEVVVLSVNLQNFYGDASNQTFASRGKNHTHLTAAEVMSQAKYHHADVICTQEDEHGLALSEFDEVASACKHGHRGKEVVRTYVRHSWHKDCSFAVVEVPKSDECPMPTRCALLVALPMGVTVANVFLAGGRHDDQLYFSHWGCADARKTYISNVLAYRPAIVVGDWNSSSSLHDEDSIYTLSNPYVKDLIRHAGENRAAKWLDSWLEFRHSPFVTLREHGYELAWPSAPTAVRGNVAVDGFAYDPGQCTPNDEYQPKVIDFFKHYTDHAGVVAAFQIGHEGVNRKISLPSSGPESPAISHLVRPPSKLKHAAPPLGVLFRATDCDLRMPQCLSSKSKRMTREERQVAAGTHVLLTGPMGPKKIKTPYTSWSGSLTEALNYGIQHSMKYIWRYCPIDLTDTHDIRTQSGVRRLNREMPTDARRIRTHEGYKVSAAWAKYKNLDSGINFDQVLIPRETLEREHGQITQAEIESPVSSAVQAVLDEQKGNIWYDSEHGVQSYYPQVAFIRNEDRLRQLIFPNAHPSDADCAQTQPTRQIDKGSRRRANYIHSSSESEITDAGSIPAFSRSKSSSRSRGRSLSS